MSKTSTLLSVVVILILTSLYVLEQFEFIQVDVEDLNSKQKVEQLQTSSQELKEITYSTVKRFDYVFCNNELNKSFYPCLNLFIDEFNTANSSIHCALYELDEENITKTLINKINLGINFSLIVDDNYIEEESIHQLKNIGIHVLNDSKSSGDRFMHEKFCIIDKEKVLLGSANPTKNGVYVNDNVVAIIEDEILAQEFYEELHQLQQEKFSKKKSINNFTHQKYRDVLGPEFNMEFEVAFCPQENCEKKVSDILNLSQKSIYFATFVLTLDSIERILLEKNIQGIEILGVSESRLANAKGSIVVKNLSKEFSVKKDQNPKTMHHKLFIVDSQYVIFGSMNPSASGAYYNDEFVILLNSSTHAKEFEKEFFRIYNQSVDFE